jgi:hypothetical protein
LVIEDRAARPGGLHSISNLQSSIGRLDDFAMESQAAKLSVDLPSRSTCEILAISFVTVLHARAADPPMLNVRPNIIWVAGEDMGRTRLAGEIHWQHRVRVTVPQKPRAFPNIAPYVPAAFMATIRPFPALRPQPQLAAEICELPYDVMSSEEARQVAAGNPLSFLHVSKPEIDLPPTTDIYAPEVYAKGRENFQSLINLGTLKQDAKPGFYLYRQIMGAHSQVGLVAVASCQEYLEGIIKKHELTRIDKEDDRVRHIEALDSQTGPVFLTYRAVVAIDAFVNRKIEDHPDVDFIAADGVRHTAWIVADDVSIGVIQREFARIPALYIADGHHRSAAAARVYQSRRGVGHSAWFLTVIFPTTRCRYSHTIAC